MVVLLVVGIATGAIVPVLFIVGASIALTAIVTGIARWWEDRQGYQRELPKPCPHCGKRATEIIDWLTESGETITVRRCKVCGHERKLRPRTLGKRGVNMAEDDLGELQVAVTRQPEQQGQAGRAQAQSGKDQQMPARTNEKTPRQRANLLYVLLLLGILVATVYPHVGDYLEGQGDGTRDVLSSYGYYRLVEARRTVSGWEFYDALPRPLQEWSVVAAFYRPPIQGEIRSLTEQQRCVLVLQKK